MSRLKSLKKFEQEVTGLDRATMQKIKGGSVQTGYQSTCQNNQDDCDSRTRVDQGGSNWGPWGTWIRIDCTKVGKLSIEP